MLANLLEADEWALEISEEMRQQAWAASRNQSNAKGCWTAYVNTLAVQRLQSLLESDQEQQAAAWPSRPTAQSEIWEVTTGSALGVGQHRLIVIPSESIDTTELSVPQEWVDIPSWVGDYYVAVQVDPAEEHLQILGYATHQQLKTQGHYDAFDRSYGVPVENLIHWDNFALTYGDYATDQTQATVAPLPSLSASQMAALIQRLGQSAEPLPRLEVPFQQWGALLEHEQSLRQLYEARCQINRPVTRLSSWLNGEFQALWETLDSLVAAPRFANAARGDESSEEQADGEMVYRAKQLTLSAEANVVLSIGIAALESTTYRVVLKLDPVKDSAVLPGEVAVRLLSLEEEELGQASATASETIEMQFRAHSGEQFKVEVASGEGVVQERFEI